MLALTFSQISQIVSLGLGAIGLLLALIFGIRRRITRWFVVGVALAVLGTGFFALFHFFDVSEPATIHTVVRAEETEELVDEIVRLIREMDEEGAPVHIHIQVRAPQDTDKIHLICPAQTIRDACPTFQWSALEQATQYQIIVEQGDKEIWRCKTTGTSIKYPPDAPNLEVGAKYLWTVRDTNGISEATPEVRAFQLLSEKQAEKLDGHRENVRVGRVSVPKAEHFSRAVIEAGILCRGFDLYVEAAELLAKHCNQHGDDREAMLLLKHVYEQLGWDWNLSNGPSMP